MQDGRVTLVAKDATVRQILAEWARVGQTKIVNVERIPGGPVTLELTNVPEAQALDMLLRSSAATSPRRGRSTPRTSRTFDRIIVMPTLRAPRPPASAAPPAPVLPAAAAVHAAASRRTTTRTTNGRPPNVRTPQPAARARLQHVPAAAGRESAGRAADPAAAQRSRAGAAADAGGVADAGRAVGGVVGPGHGRAAAARSSRAQAPGSRGAIPSAAQAARRPQ